MNKNYLLLFLLLSTVFYLFPNLLFAAPTELFGSNLIADIAERVSPAVVAIESVNYVKTRTRTSWGDPVFDRVFGHLFDDDFFGLNNVIPRRGDGSGVLISADGHLLTNEHVIGEADEIIVKLATGESFKAKVVGMDPRTDLAVLKIEAERPLAYVPIGESDSLRVGEWVIAIGNPFNLGITVTAGVISALNRDLSVDRNRNYRDLIQTDASINPGNSGGALLNSKGELIGINTAIIPSGQGIGFAIPVNRAKRIIGDLIAYGHVKKAFLGVRVQDISPQLAAYFEIEKKGVLVTEVASDTSGKKAGLVPGDVIVAIGDTLINSVEEFQTAIEDQRVGEKAVLKIVRRGKEGLCEVEFSESPTFANILGIELKTIDRNLTRQYHLFVTLGCVITFVEPNSPAERAGLRQGDVIQQVNRTTIENKADFDKSLQGLELPAKILLRVVRERTVNLLVITVE